jgi:hypothetical protein
MVVNLVCRSWRNTALSCPSLWSVIDSSSISKAQLCLKRSKSAPLSVNLRYGCPNSLIEAVLSQMSRVRELDITFATSMDLSLLPHLTECPAPMLRKLSVYYDEQNNEDDDFVLQPPPLLELDAPVLQMFSLTGFSLLENQPAI